MNKFESDDIIWLVQDFGQELDNLKQSIRKSRATLELSQLKPYEIPLFQPSQQYLNCPVIFYGSLEMANEVNKYKIYPGALCDLSKYKCSFYYSKIYQYLLNQNHIFLPYGELLQKQDFIFETLGNNNSIFIRPDAGNKPFTGEVIYRERFYKEIESLSYSHIPSDLMCVISEPINIQEEYRLFCVDKQIITGSLYKRNNQLITSKIIPNNIIDYASKVVREFQPERCFVIDIGLTSDGPKVIELNSFSCSGLYDSPTDNLVLRTNQVIKEIYLEYTT